MDIRQVLSPAETATLGTAQLRANYLIEGLFQAGTCQMTYSHLDRTVVAGFMPGQDALSLRSSKQIGSPNFLDRREAGVANIGGTGTVEADGQIVELAHGEIVYLPMGTKKVQFKSADPANPARFYVVSTPAHHVYPLIKITLDQANLIELGDQADANVRKLRQYIHPDVCSSCQLTMGITLIETGSVWNTMPCHTHDRRSEVYLYFDMQEDTRVVHLMGAPDETRHLIVANEQAILSPGWSIHSGAGTGRYGFIWSMAGDNQDFNDMDFVDMADLK